MKLPCTVTRSDDFSLLQGACTGRLRIIKARKCYEILDSHGGIDESSPLMGCYTMLSGEQLLSFLKSTGSGSPTKLRQYAPSKPEKLFTCQHGTPSQKSWILNNNFSHCLSCHSTANMKYSWLFTCQPKRHTVHSKNKSSLSSNKQTNFMKLFYRDSLINNYRGKIESFCVSANRDVAKIWPRSLTYGMLDCIANWYTASGILLAAHMHCYLKWTGSDSAGMTSSSCPIALKNMDDESWLLRLQSQPVIISRRKRIFGRIRW